MDNVSVEKTKLDKIADSIATADGGGNMTLDDMPGRINVLGANNVKYIPQELTEDQKKQARENIGALPVGLGMTGTAVGQIARIKAVDASGKPTAWEPVDMPSGGSKWEDIGTFDLSGLTILNVNKDSEGKPFDANKMFIEFNVAKGRINNGIFCELYDKAGTKRTVQVQGFNQDGRVYGRLFIDLSTITEVTWVNPGPMSYEGVQNVNGIPFTFPIRDIARVQFVILSDPIAPDSNVMIKAVKA